MIPYLVCADIFYLKKTYFRYQSAVSGGENENGELSESDNDEECSEDPSVIKPSKYKEKVFRKTIFLNILWNI